MAGICGIIQKLEQNDNPNLEVTFDAMLEKLSAEELQSRKKITLDKIYIGAVAPIGQDANDYLIINEEFSIYCLIEGVIYIEDSIKRLIQDKYRIQPLLKENEYLPLLYLYFNTDFVKKITGWQNIFIYDGRKQNAYLTNDRLGLLPLFYYESPYYILFSSRIDCILASGFMRSIEFDLVTLTEQLLFNYGITHRSLIRDIRTLPAASLCCITDSSIHHYSYWNPTEMFEESPLSKKSSVDLIDEALYESLKKPFFGNGDRPFSTITGGWDGRLVLSYLSKNSSNKVYGFSFGAESSPDIIIPQNIATSKNLEYTPFYLNQSYIENSFISAGCNTIKYSNGTRSYRRAHYLYVMQFISKQAQTIISGNFGDEILKFSQVLPSEVISQNLIAYSQSDFRKRPIDNNKNSFFGRDGILCNSWLIDEWNQRLSEIENELSIYSSINQKFAHLKLTRIARGYFGNEAQSYNDYVKNFSPFLDFDFISAFSKSYFSSIFYPFNSNRMKYKQLSTFLYSELIKRNDKELLSFPTDRGYSIADTRNPLGNLYILYRKWIRPPQKHCDPYFLAQGDILFESFSKKTIQKEFLPSEQHPNYLKNRRLSLNYWMNYIAKEYSI